MRRFLFQLVLAGVVFASRFDGLGFALNGPIMPYQTALGPGGSPHPFAPYTGVVGPQARDEEYRWNVPVVTYGFDQAFFNYFGTNGINSIEEIFKILNNLPPTSQITDQVLSNYLFTAEDINLQASTLFVIDLKSYALSAVLGHVGLADPELYVWSLRNRQVFGNPSITNYVVIQRNYDPITRFPSAVVNGTTYSYSLDGDFLQTLPSYSSTAAGGINGVGRFASGFYGHAFWGLTYDDVGGIRQIYATNNFNMERALPSVFLLSAAAAVAVSGGGGGGSIWNGPFLGSNGVVAGGIWDGSLTSSATNLVGGGTVVTNTATTNAFLGVNVALRGGLDKITYLRVNFDSILAQGFLALTNSFGDQFITNGVVLTQFVGRQILTPDILFRAADLGLIGPPQLPISSSDLTVAQINNYDLNIAPSSLARGDTGPNGPNYFVNGPGVMSPGNEIAFSTLFPWYLNFAVTGFTTGPNVLNGAIGVWGTFDSSSISAIYPVFMNLQISDLERLVQQSQLQP